MNLNKDEEKNPMIQILITTIYCGKVTTCVAQAETDVEAEKIVNYIKNARPPEMMTRHAERLN